MNDNEGQVPSACIVNRTPNEVLTEFAFVGVDQGLLEVIGEHDDQIPLLELSPNLFRLASEEKRALRGHFCESPVRLSAEVEPAIGTRFRQVDRDWHQSTLGKPLCEPH